MGTVMDAANKMTSNKRTSDFDEAGGAGRPVLRAFFIIFANALLGAIAGVIFHHLEYSNEIEERTSRAMTISQYISQYDISVNSSTTWDNTTSLTQKEVDWKKVVEALGWTVQGLQEDIIAVQDGTLTQKDADWDYSSAMFFAFTVATSIGYGSFAPKTKGGRGFTVAYALISIPLMLVAFTNLCDVILASLASRFAGRKRDLPVKVFRMLDKDNSGTLDRAEVLAALRLMGLQGYSGRNASWVANCSTPPDLD